MNLLKSNLQKSSNTSNSEINVNSFNDMNLKIDILRGIDSLGFVNPTVLQQRVIVHCLNGQDAIVFSGLNSGRTMMFTIPLLQRIKTNLNECQALILVPSQNSAVHIQKVPYYNIILSVIVQQCFITFLSHNIDHNDYWRFLGY